MDVKDFIANGSNLVMIAVTVLPIIAGIVVYFVQNKARKDSFFRDCAKSLRSDNSVEQATAAILLRDFIDKSSYKNKTKNLIVSVLRPDKGDIDNPGKRQTSVALQKTLADGFSFARSLKGQDMQYVNMKEAVIKPKSRIKYELTGMTIFNRIRVSMKQVDFYQATIQDCNFNNINAKKAVFYSTNLCGSRFHNCLLNDANFRSANLKGAVFDEDCVLEGASFTGAVGLGEAKVKVKEKSGTKGYPLINFLDKNAVFRLKGSSSDEKYEEKRNITIFVSKLGIMDAKQQQQYDRIISIINNLSEKVEIDTIERSQYKEVSPITDTMAHLEKCYGCVIFAFEYLKVNRGSIHKDTSSKDDFRQVDNMVLTSPWMHVETALAISKGIPCLVVYDPNMLLDGMFDTNFIDQDSKLIAMKYLDSIQPNNDTISDWFKKVLEYQ